MKEIKLTQGKIALVDDEDFEWLNQYKWHVQKSRHTCYASGYVGLSGQKVKTAMHRLILGITDPKVLGDHKDLDGLNNQRSNLRIATLSQNQCNAIKPRKGSVKYRGVSLDYGGFSAGIRANNKFIYLGRFDTQEEAAEAYNTAAKEYHGEFAIYNDVVHGEGFDIQNIRIRRGSSTGYRGVVHKKWGKFCAQIGVNKKKVHLGSYATPEEAARAYNMGAIKYYGEMAVLNEI